MNKKIQLSALFLSVLFISCGNDDDNDNNDNEITFTENNYFYEGELYSQYLTNEVEELDETIAELEDIIENQQGTEETQAQLDEAIQLRDNINIEIEAVPSTEARIILPPRPPCPVGSCIPLPELQYVLTPQNVSLLQIELFTANDVLIGSSSSSLNVFAPDDDFKYQEMNITDNTYEGLITVKIKRTVGNVVTTYTTFAEIQ